MKNTLSFTGTDFGVMDNSQKHTFIMVNWMVLLIEIKAFHLHY